MALGKPLKLAVSSGKALATKTVKVDILNREFGDLAAPSRDYQLIIDASGCPAGTVSRLDANASMAGLQQVGTVWQGGKTSASFVVTVRLDAVTSVESQTPWRCVLEVTAEALDTAPAADDAINPANNTTFISLELFDGNDL